MQYIFLRGIIESTLQNFHCPQCQSKTFEQNIQIMGISPQGADISIACGQCQANTMLHAEINTMASELMSNEHGQKFMDDYLKKWGNISAHMSPTDGVQKIKDEDITQLYKDLKDAHTVEDILGKNE